MSLGFGVGGIKGFAWGYVTSILDRLPIGKSQENPSTSSTLKPSTETSTVRHSNRTSSSLEKKAQLSVVKTAQNLGYNIFWGTISIPLSIKSWTWDVVTNRLMGEIVQSAATKAMGKVVLPEPDTLLKRLRNSLEHLYQTLASNVEISSQLKTDMIEILDDFIANQKTYLRDARDSRTGCFKYAGFRSTLDYEQEQKFSALSTTLKKKLPIDKSFVAELFKMIDERWTLERKFHVSKMTKELLGTAQDTVVPDLTHPTLVQQDRSRFYETLDRKSVV